jgi:uncharacterized membrane protein YfcA
MAAPFTPEEILLLGVAFLVSLWNASVGPTGAITFATMASVLPPAAVVPVHAVSEAYAAAARWLFFRQHIDWRYVGAFALGALAGFALAWPLLEVGGLPDHLLRILLGSFILATTWLPLPPLGAGQAGFPALGGGVTSFLTLFVGATAPLVAALIAQRHQDHRLVLGTSAVCMALQHGAKIPIFGLLGFSFAAFGQLLVALCLLTALGSWLGRRVLIAVDQAKVRILFKAVVTLLGIKLILDGAQAWL